MVHFGGLAQAGEKTAVLDWQVPQYGGACSRISVFAMHFSKRMISFREILIDHGFSMFFCQKE